MYSLLESKAEIASAQRKLEATIRNTDTVRRCGQGVHASDALHNL